jgi:hypothetical protein
MCIVTRTCTKVSRIPKGTKSPFSSREFVAFAIFVVFVLAFVVPASAAVVDPELRVVIRTYDASAAAGDLSLAQAVSAAILEDAGLAVTWVRCDAVFVQRDENPCVAPLAANELAIRFVRLPAHLADHDLVTLGDSLVDTQRRTGSLATIYVNRVAALAAQCQVDGRALLGRAVAHEIGHLLMGTSSHASAGLMRATWSQNALRSDRVGDWTFAPQEAVSMRDAVRVRNARRMAAARIGE